MKFLIDLSLIIALAFGGGFATSEIYLKVKKATIAKIKEGLPPLTPFNEKLTGKKSRFR